MSTRARSIIRISLWLLGSLLIGASGLLVGARTVLPGPSSTQALSENFGEVLAKEKGIAVRDTVTLVLSNPAMEVVAAEFSRARDSLVSTLEHIQDRQLNAPLFAGVETWEHSASPLAQGFISRDRRNLLVNAKLRTTLDRSAESLRAFESELQDWRKQFPAFGLVYLSNGTADNEMFELINRDLDRSLIYTLPLTLLILLWTFRTIVAAALPLVMALVSLSSSLGVAALLSRWLAPISATAAQLVVLLVLAVGVDYSLFLVTRVRDEVRGGKSYPEAVGIARRRTGLSVFWSGLTVALSLLGLFFIQDTILTSMATVSLVAVVITVFGSIVVLPEILLVLGPKLESGKIRGENKMQANPLLRKWIRFSAMHPWKVVCGCLACLLPIAMLCVRLELGTTVQPSTMPDSMQSRAAFTVLKKHFPDLAGTDLSIIINAKSIPELFANKALDPFLQRLREISILSGPLGMDISSDQTTVRMSFILRGTANSPEAEELVHALRTQFIPQLLEPLSIRAWLGGTLPFSVDADERYLSRTPEAFGFVLLLSVVMLCMAFRSLIVPLKAVLLNILSTMVAFGSLMLLFQTDLVPAWNYGVIESFIPPLLFSILFGLSMDYHVFLLSRVNEERLGGLDTREAVIKGLLETSRVITSAALIMVSVFVIVACLELPVMKQLGVGLAIAVLLDATIIRTLLLPASMVLLGEWNWYLPKWMEWLPRMKLES